MAEIRVTVGQVTGSVTATDAKAAPVLTKAGKWLGIDPDLPAQQRADRLAQKIAEWLVGLARLEHAQEGARAAEAEANATIGLE